MYIWDNIYISLYCNSNITLYTDEHLKWDKPPMAVCLFN